MLFEPAEVIGELLFELRFELFVSPSRWRRRQCCRPPLQLTRSRLTYSKEVARRVVHGLQACPLLPAVRQRFGGGIEADFRTVRSDESGSKARAALADKLLEGHTSQSNQPHEIVTVPSDVTKD